jgi:hypothetical protein
VSPQLIIPGQSTLTNQLFQNHHLQQCTWEHWCKTEV